MRNITNCLGSPWLAMVHVPVLLAVLLYRISAWHINLARTPHLLDVVGIAGVSLAAAAHCGLTVPL